MLTKATEQRQVIEMLCTDIPDFAINMETESIGKYGRMLLRHLQEHRPDLYQQIILLGNFMRI